MKNALMQAYIDVLAFHDACDIHSPSGPMVPRADRKKLRRKLIDEEVNNELFPAMEADDLPGIADAIADSIYVLIGTALEYGIPLPEVWDAVQKANIGKVDEKTGKVIRREDGKILKPEGWSPPDIAAILKKFS